jgi:hypothetical protein
MAYKIQFKNNCETLPIAISTWKSVSSYVSKYEDTIVSPQTEITLYSNVGEWTVSSFFREKEHMDLWKPMECDSMMATFRHTPCAMGKYTWNYSRDFEIKYEDGVVSWSYLVDSR